MRISSRIVFANLTQQLSALYARREAQTIAFELLEHFYQLSKTDILSDKYFKPAENQELALQEALVRLQKHEPLQYILQKAYFLGKTFYVTPAVLIPRPETEELVSWIVQENLSNKHLTDFHVLDIGTGSGCIALTVKALLPFAQVTSIDISPEALQVARYNAQKLGLEVNFLEVDFLTQTELLTNQFWNVIVSNPPYISPHERQDIAPNVLAYEPHLALFPPENLHSLIFYEKIAQFAQKQLASQGTLFFELNPLYASAIEQLVKDANFSEITIRADMQGKLRMLRAKKT
ncbi:MAG: peptide chain release factor N(5)-glutamine methyltransferase [Microscillaceae bacterium]|nr:peptide chain release factor N(5)-glutamine methyltransferase [Microscillaceae bacterium]MDW8460119.1 peptide chain release factor N(5)-glutamine methyltransferase [Cytophagales bacterium]